MHFGGYKAICNCTVVFVGILQILITSLWLIRLRNSPGDGGVQEELLERLEPLPVGRGQRENLLEARPPDLSRQQILELHVAAVEAIPDRGNKTIDL